jgi:hypothetical protein
VSEQLTYSELVEHAVVVDDLDSAAAHDAQVTDRLSALREDRRTGGMALGLGGRRHALEVVLA